MAYIGYVPVDVSEASVSTVDNFAAGVGFTAGSSTTVTLSTVPASENSIVASFDGVTQHHNTYTLSGAIVTFDTAIPTGTSNVEVIHYNSIAITAVGDATVTAAKIADGAVTVAKLGTGALIGTNIQAFDADTAKLDVAQVYSASQRGTVQASGSLIANTTFRQNFATGNMFSMTLAGNIVINNPTNQVAGQGGIITITNGGSHTVSWGADWDFAAATAPVITVSGTDVLSYYVTSANNITVSAVQAVS